MIRHFKIVLNSAHFSYKVTPGGESIAAVAFPVFDDQGKYTETISTDHFALDASAVRPYIMAQCNGGEVGLDVDLVSIAAAISMNLQVNTGGATLIYNNGISGYRLPEHNCGMTQSEWDHFRSEFTKYQRLFE
jgi:hypothetical protein